MKKSIDKFGKLAEVTSMRVLILTKGQHTVVSQRVYEWASKFKWTAQPSRRTFYAIRSIGNGAKQKKIRLHREILGAAPGDRVDHIDGDGLNNLDNNLRLCTVQENNHNAQKRLDNASGYKGVCYCNRSKKWVARITLNKKGKHLGYFSTSLEAAHAYDNAALRLHGDFARLNFPAANNQQLIPTCQTSPL